MKARVFKKEECFNRESTLLKKMGFRCEVNCIDNANKCYPTFQDTKEEMPEWSGAIYAEYYYDEAGDLTDIIAPW